MKKIIVLITSVVFLLGFVAFTFAGSSEWRNHGQYVKSQKNKREAAQSRIGMPVNSKGHTSDPNDQTIVINFDDIALGDYGDSLRYGDVTIETYPGSHLEVTDQSADGFGNAHSLPNKLSVWGDQPLVPKEKTSFLVVFDYPVQEVSFWLTGTFHDTTVNAYDVNDNLVATFLQTYPKDGPLAPDGTPWDYYYDRVLRFINIEATDISKISIQPSAYDGFSIDDLTYSP